MQQVALFVGDAAVLKGGVLGMSRGIQGRLPGNRSPFGGLSSWYQSAKASVCKGHVGEPKHGALGFQVICYFRSFY